MGCQSFKPTTNRGRKKITDPWAEFCSNIQKPPIIGCVTAIEEVCQKLEKGEAEELRGEVKAILKKACPPTQHHQGRAEGHGRIKKRYHQDSTDSRQGGGPGSHEQGGL